jgi:hypothetical protein
VVQSDQAHVQDLDHLSISRQEQVGGLDVPVDHASLVGVLQSQRRLPDVVAGFRQRQRADLFDQPGQVGGPLEVLHDQQLGSAVLLGVEGEDDVGVVQLGRRPYLPLEAADRVGAVQALLADELDGDGPAQVPVPGLEDLSHAALTQPLLKDVGSQNKLLASPLQ